MPGLPYLRGRGGLRGAPRDGAHARRRAVAAAPAARLLDRDAPRDAAPDVAACSPPSSAGTTAETERQVKRLSRTRDERERRSGLAALDAAPFGLIGPTDAARSRSPPGSVGNRHRRAEHELRRVWSTAWRAVGIEVDTDDAVARAEAEPRLVAARHAVGARAGECRRRRRGRRPARRRPTRWPPCSPTANEAGVPVTPAAGRSGVCGGERARVRRRRARRHGLAGIVRRRRRVAVARRARRHVRRRPRSRTARRPRPHARPLAAVHRALDGRAAGWRAAAPASTRPATARSRTWSSASTSCWPTDASSAPAARRAPRSVPTSPNCSSDREGTLGVITEAPAARPSRRRRPSGGPPTASTRSTPGSTRAGASCAAAPRRPCCGCTTGPSRRARTAPTADTCVLLVLDEGDDGRRRRGDGRRRPTSARDADRSSTTRCVERWLDHRNDVSALEAAHRQGLRRRHDGDRGAVARARPASTTPRPPRCSPCPTHRGRDRPPVPRYTDGACLYFTFAAIAPPDEREATYVALWDAGTRAVLAARRQPQPPPRRRAQPGPLRGRALWARASACSPPSRPPSTRTASSTRASSGCRRRSARCRGRDRPRRHALAPGRRRGRGHRRPVGDRRRLSSSTTTRSTRLARAASRRRSCSSGSSLGAGVRGARASATARRSPTASCTAVGRVRRRAG